MVSWILWLKRLFNPRHPLGFLIGAMVGLAAVGSCSPQLQKSQLEQIQETGVLRVLMRNTSVTYYEGRDGPAGFEYDLLKAFAQQQGLTLEVITSPSIEDIETRLSKGQADLAAAGVAITPKRLHTFALTHPVIKVQPQVVYRRGASVPKDVADLAGQNLAVVAGTKHADLLRKWQETYKNLTWKETRELEASDLLQRIQAGELDYAIINIHEWVANRWFFPQVAAAFTLQEPMSLVWMSLPHAETSLIDALNTFLAQQRQNGHLNTLYEHYFGHERYFGYVGAQYFLKHVEGRLPEYLHLFQAAAQKYDFDWLLLAAVAYQESHWRPDAVSPTLVKGLMMLTHATARQMGVEDRRDPKQSIFGGAGYLRHLIERLPERIAEPDRTYMALAAYNIGLGHLEDARILTQSQGKNPDLWQDVSEHLPLLQYRQWYSQTRYGYARGGAPVIYVRNIRRYHEILQWYYRTQENLLDQLQQRSVDIQADQAFSIVPPIL
ncbi:membrane-bound lytic murein transglycosylase MltF [Allopseudospirillum japonicum]|uniref:membrane-bound lytic murein transglycosylase MltF n=1 Tax=Allopseudospirillum japonicum TaxID=64971 RepID=UPI000B81ECFA|nr:membrane-bound lytic murein transglycosylase MltF [Allopseudospirillum japonicum]